MRAFTKSTDLVIRTKKLIKKSRETVPLNMDFIGRKYNQINRE
jgi:hypothetical protein